MPDRLFKWLRPENRKPFYVTVALVVFCMMGLIVYGMEGIDSSASLEVQIAQRQKNDAMMKLFGFGGAIITGIFLMVRSEQSTTYQHKSSHDIRNAAGAASLNAVHAANTADDAAKKAEEAVRNAEAAVKVLHEVRKEVHTALNGGLSKRLEEVFEQAKAAYASDPAGGTAFPRTMAELKEAFRTFADEMGDHVCKDVAEKAGLEGARQAIRELQASGVIPPSPPGPSMQL